MEASPRKVRGYTWRYQGRKGREGGGWDLRTGQAGRRAGRQAGTPSRQAGRRRQAAPALCAAALPEEGKKAGEGGAAPHLEEHKGHPARRLRQLHPHHEAEGQDGNQAAAGGRHGGRGAGQAGGAGRGSRAAGQQRPASGQAEAASRAGCSRRTSNPRQPSAHPTAPTRPPTSSAPARSAGDRCNPAQTAHSRAPTPWPAGLRGGAEARACRGARRRPQQAQRGSARAGACAGPSSDARPAQGVVPASQPAHLCCAPGQGPRTAC